MQPTMSVRNAGQEGSGLKVYTVAEFEVVEREWIPEYVRNVTRMIEERGGRYLARTSRAEKLEGSRPLSQIVLLIEWPSREAADAFYGSDDYRPFLQSRVAGSRTEMMIVPGEDITGAAKIE
jgi:uncharacterized protein (DUF1330 family)